MSAFCAFGKDAIRPMKRERQRFSNMIGPTRLRVVKYISPKKRRGLNEALAYQPIYEAEMVRLAGLLIRHWAGHRGGEQCWHRNAFECAHIRMYGGTWQQIERKRIHNLAWRLGVSQLPAGIQSAEQLWQWCLARDRNEEVPETVPKKPVARVDWENGILSHTRA